MTLKRSSTQGFTLIEILIVIVVIAILTGLAVPAYQASIEKSRRSEAITNLSAIRQSELRYYTQYGAYTNNLQRLDVTPTGQFMGASRGGQAPSFGYGISSASSSGFAAYATRLNNIHNYNYSIQIDQMGRVQDIPLTPMPAFAMSAPQEILVATYSADKAAE